MALPWYYRFYFYAIHGFFDEVVFTCLYDCYFLGFDVQLKGYSSLYVFPMYGIPSLFVDYLYLNYLKGRCNRVIRGLIYILIAFTSEFFSGFILSKFSACTWDYSANRYNIYGLITLEYAPVWLVSGFICEFFANVMQSMCIKTNEKSD